MSVTYKEYIQYPVASTHNKDIIASSSLANSVGFCFRHKEDFSPEQVRTLEEMFRQNLPHNKTELTLQEFKKIMPSKNVSYLQITLFIYANLAIQVITSCVLLVTRCISQTLDGLVAFR